MHSYAFCALYYGTDQLSDINGWSAAYLPLDYAYPAAIYAKYTSFFLTLWEADIGIFY